MTTQVGRRGQQQREALRKFADFVQQLEDGAKLEVGAGGPDQHGPPTSVYMRAIGAAGDKALVMDPKGGLLMAKAIRTLAVRFGEAGHFAYPLADQLEQAAAACGARKAAKRLFRT